jgi:hypothetical protein
MTTEQFAYWLKGFFELQNPHSLTGLQVQKIKDHLDLVFDKKTPDRDFVNDYSDIVNNPGTNPYDPLKTIICSSPSPLENPLNQKLC